MTQLPDAGPAPVAHPPVTLPSARTCPFDPPPEYAELRETCPVAPLALTVGPGDGAGWLVTGLADVRAVLSDRRFSHRNELIALPIPPPFPMTDYDPPPAAPGAFIKMDQPDHSRYRRLLTRRFTMRGVAALTPMITRLTEEYLDAMAGADGPVDLVSTFAEPLTVRVMCEMLGVPEPLREPLAGHLAVLSRMHYTVEELIEACTVIAEALQELVAAKRADPGTDLLGELAADDGLTDEEVVNIAWALLGGGFDTTANMLALGTFALLAHPDQLALLRARPELADNAVEQLLRYLTISHLGASRAALEDVELNGTRIKAGDTVVLALSAANRDPGHFDAPDRLDITAEAQGHVAFGHGEHQCIGQNLARATLRTALPMLFDRFPALRLATPAEEVPLRSDMLHYGVHELLVDTGA
ncbi:MULTISPECIES: cytochrome P450 [unclassified Streptomyces]|uniref:cytochrome P450 n=1 Tax=unclassified Streptomyces TaxID=2593676 RepID=UPI00035CE184|nr:MULTISPECIES: cytochrome P450 [unclassified Streptomyces]MYY03357.1 cytochrome P450 [Streptomyces sp. SID4913]